MRNQLLARLGPQGWLKTSYQPRRRGFLVHTSRTLEELRYALPRRWVRRVSIVHEPSGKYFLEPTPTLLACSLELDAPRLWWNLRHESAAREFFSATRQERVRRLPRTGGRPGWMRGAALLTDLALRLEALAGTPQPEKHWRALADSFDDMWKRVRLSAEPVSPLALASFSYLRRLRELIPGGV